MWKIKKLICLVLALFLLTACSGGTNRGNIISLLSAPKLSKTESDIVDTLVAYLGENITLKYSKSLGYSAPIQIIDTDSDGAEEAFVFYYAPNKGANIRLAILNYNLGKWMVLSDKEGLGSEVFTFKIASLSPISEKQAVVGYYTPNTDDKFFAVYFLGEESYTQNYSEKCVGIEIGDMTQDGFEDIIVIGETLDNRTRIQLLTLNLDNTFSVVATRQLKVSDIEVTKLTLANGGKTIYIDYKDNYKKMYTEAVNYNGTNFENAIAAGSLSRLWEYSFDLNSKDIDGNGKIEIPVVISEEVQDTLPVLKFVQWINGEKEQESTIFYGVCDTQSGLFLPLPMEWQNVVDCSYSQDFWTVTRKDSGETLVKIEQLPFNSMPEMGDNVFNIRIDSRRWQVTFSTELDQEQKTFILQNINVAN